MNNEEIAKHTGVSIDRVNQIEADLLDRISKAISPCPVFAEADDHERLKQERDNLAAQLTSAKEENARLSARLLEIHIACGDAIRAPSPIDGLRMLSEQLATVTKERDEFEKLSLGWEYECGHDRARIDALALQLAVANERAEKAEGCASRCADQNDLTWKAATAVRHERDSLLLQLQQENERAAVCNRLNTAYSENLLAVQAALDFLDEGSGANTTVALGLKAAEEINSLRTQLLQCQAARAKKDEALQAQSVFYTPLSLSRKPNRQWDEYEIDAINRTRSALSTSPATALAEFAIQVFRDGHSWGRKVADQCVDAAFMNSDTRKKLP